VSSSRFAGAKRGLFAVFVAASMSLFVAPASARDAYVTNSGEGSVSVVDVGTDAVIATVPVGLEPVDVAITPDGKRAYVANMGDDSVSVIDIATSATVGAPIAVGSQPRGIAITPDGSRAYVSNGGGDTVSVLDTATNSVLGGPLEIGTEPDGVAISPDGRFAFVAQRGGEISVIDTATNAVVDTVEDGLAPSRIAIGPRGGRGFVTNAGSSSVSAFNPINRSLVGAPIASGTQPAGIAIEPSGSVAYVASPLDGTLTPINTSIDSVLGPPLSGFPGATGVAFAPGGLEGLVTDGAGESVTSLDATREIASGATAVGKEPRGLAFTPNQGPQASFFISPTRKRAKKKLTFHGSGSTDSDGSIENYAWDFGDGGHVEGTATTRVHQYRRPGTYQVTLVVTDDEGCSTEFVFTGQTAYCNGSAAAAFSSLITVVDATGPVLRLRGSRRQRLGGRVKVFARCPARPCAFRARGFVVTSVEAHGAKRRIRYRLGQASVLRPSRGWRRLALRVRGRTRRAVRRALRRGGTAKARLTVIATDGDGDQTLKVRKVKLVRPPRRR
jgi:YVTN family beta-propeller protein